MKYVMSWDECIAACREYIEKKTDYQVSADDCYFSAEVDDEGTLEELEFTAIEHREGE